MLLRRKGRNRAPLHEHFQFETLRVSNIRPVVSREKRCFSAQFGPCGAVPPPRVLPFFSKVKRSWGASRRPRPPEYFSFSYAHKRGYGNCIAKKNFCANKKEERPREAFLFFTGKTLKPYGPSFREKNAAFPPASDRAALRCNLAFCLFQRQHAPRAVNTILQTISIDRINRQYARHLSLEAGSPRIPDFSPIKARWGRDGGLGGRETPLALAEGFPFPPNNLRIVVTGSNGRDIASCRRRAR